MAYFDRILLGICNKLQLQESLYSLATDRYEAITNTIQNDDIFKDVDLRIYPQGSFKLKTTVKPLKGNEYDLDFVAELPENANMTPGELYDNIFRILSTDGVHNNMVEKKTRCVRINYANDFHMDIMPGKAIDRFTNEIIVPDRELKNWYHHSNPLGYAQWFEKQAESHIRYILFEQRALAGNTAPIDDQEITMRLEPLRRAVQLIKRYRDLYCDKTGGEPVRSIVICTLMGHISSSYSNELDIITDFCSYVNERIKDADKEPFEVRNPVVDEVLTEKWSENKQNYKDFVAMINELTADVAKLKHSSTNVDSIIQAKKMFGEGITNDVVTEEACLIEKNRKAGTLSVDATGILNANKDGVTVKNNTFYGR